MNDYIDSETVRTMFLAGTKYLDNKKEMINDLNVFPVPDGDTGTNMMLTLMSAVNGISELPEDASMEEVCSKITQGTLRGARGNSGVILSQLCRGFVKGIQGLKNLHKEDFAIGFKKAREAAYKAVMNPTEGTILTISRAVSDKSEELKNKDISLKEFFAEILASAKEALKKTPEMLPVLKQAGVVDSGGSGLVEFLNGAYDSYIGTDIDLDFSDTSSCKDAAHSSETSHNHEGEDGGSMYGHIIIDTSNIETANIKYGYCTEFIIELDREFPEEEEDSFKQFLVSNGDSVVCVGMDDIVKVHVHTNHPGKVIEKALTYGQLSSLKIDNMRIEHNENVIKEADRQLSIEKENTKAGLQSELSERTEFGFVSVCTGDGITELFKDLNVDEVIQGGQTMNPSTQDIVSAIHKVNADNVYVLPNNRNIIMAANQASELCTDKNVFVIPTGNICQGISAMINFSPARDAQQNFEHMQDAALSIHCGEVTYSIRDTQIGSVNISKDDYMGIADGKIVSASKDLTETVVNLCARLADEDSSIVTIYYGNMLSEEDAEATAEAIEEQLPDLDIEITYGGQQVYNYIISVE